MKKFKFLSLLFMAMVTMFAFTACGDDKDDNNNKGNNGGNENGGSEVTEQMIVGTWETVSMTIEGQEVSVSATDQNVWQLWHRFVFGADGSFNGYSVNYKGGEGLRGRIEHTMMGRYTFDVKNMKAQLKDMVEGYHEVLEAEKTGKLGNLTINIEVVSLTENEVVYVAAMGEQGMKVTTKMKKVADVNPENPQQPEATDSVGENATIVGTWGQTHSYWVVRDTLGNVIEYHDKGRTKEDRKYIEFVFNNDGTFSKWGYENDDDESDADKGNFIEQMKGTWSIQNNYLIARFGDGAFTIAIEKLTDDTLILGKTDTESGFEMYVDGVKKTWPVVISYDRITLKRLK